MPLKTFLIYLTAMIILSGCSSLSYESINLDFAFYYGQEKNVLEKLLTKFDYVVVQPYLKYNYKNKLMLYIPVFEIYKYSEETNRIKPEWILGENTNWNTYILDLRKTECYEYVFNKVKSVFQSAYKGIFLDTLDSYMMVAPQTEWGNFENILKKLLKDLIKENYGKFIILNRGFHFLDNEISSYIYLFLVFESLYTEYNFISNEYLLRDESSINENKNYLLREKEEFKIPIIVIDYTDNSELAKEISRKIQKDGFIPYVSDIHLTNIGVGRNF